jgi:hypothetical protein
MFRRLHLLPVVAIMVAAVSAIGYAVAGENTAGPIQLTLPKVCYAAVGVPMSIYFDNIVLTEKPESYVFKVDCNFGKQEPNRWTVTPVAADVGDHPFAVSVSDAQGKTIEQGKLIVHVAAADAGAGRSIRLMMVGDSLTHATIYPNEVARLLSQPGNPQWAMFGTHPQAGRSGAGRGPRGLRRLDLGAFPQLLS